MRHRRTLRREVERVFEHAFDLPAEGPAVTHVRLSIFPDGGVSRMRLWGRVARA